MRKDKILRILRDIHKHCSEHPNCAVCKFNTNPKGYRECILSYIPSTWDMEEIERIIKL